MNFRKATLLYTLLISLCHLPCKSTDVAAHLNSDFNGELVYPLPPRSEKLLFYIQRSKNTNAIVYETNLKQDGEIDSNMPVHAYWIRYSTDSTTAELNYIQRKYAYGIESRMVEGKQGQFIINLVSYPERKIFLIPSPDGKRYEAITMIDGRMSVLERIFIKLGGGSFWFPEIEYVELNGRNPQSGKKVAEKFIPAK